MSLEFVGFHYQPIVLLYAFFYLSLLIFVIILTNQLICFWDKKEKNIGKSLINFFKKIKNLDKNKLKNTVSIFISGFRVRKNFFSNFKKIVKTKKWWIKFFIFFVEGLAFSIIFFRNVIAPRTHNLSIFALEVVKVNQTLLLVTFETKKPELITLEYYHDNQADLIYPTNTYRSQLNHNFLFETI